VRTIRCPSYPAPIAFESFFSSQPVIPQIVAESGVQGPPGFSFYRPLASPDVF